MLMASWKNYDKSALGRMGGKPRAEGMTAKRQGDCRKGRRCSLEED